MNSRTEWAHIYHILPALFESHHVLAQKASKFEKDMVGNGIVFLSCTGEIKRPNFMQMAGEKSYDINVFGSSMKIS